MMMMALPMIMLPLMMIVGVMRMHDCLPIGTILNHVHRYIIMRMHDCLPIGTIPNHVHRYTLVYGWHL
jgi:hypothetical protein